MLTDYLEYLFFMQRHITCHFSDNTYVGLSFHYHYLQSGVYDKRPSVDKLGCASDFKDSVVVTSKQIQLVFPSSHFGVSGMFFYGVRVPLIQQNNRKKAADIRACPIL